MAATHLRMSAFDAMADESVCRKARRQRTSRATIAGWLPNENSRSALRWILALRERSVDWERGVIKVSEALEETKAKGIISKAPKSKAGRRDITLPNVVIDALREHRRELLEWRMRLGTGKLTPDALLSPNLQGGPLRPSAVSSDWGDVAEDIGMPEITFHGLRHTHASQLIERGVDIVTISKRLGHTKPSVTLAIYAHLFKTDDRKAADAINAALCVS